MGMKNNIKIYQGCPDPTNRWNRWTPTCNPPDPKLQSIGSGSPPPRNDAGELSIGFLSPKPEPLDPTDDIQELRPYSARSRSDLGRSSQIRRDLDQIQRNLAKFGEFFFEIRLVQQNPMTSTTDWTDQHSPEPKNDSICWCWLSVSGPFTLHL